MLKQEQNKYRTGTLPERYPLATALTPWQESTDPAYDSADALARGTLFPGLDLPFMDMVNPELPDCPATELMAIDFVADELALYLDTHPDDKEAFALLQSFLMMRDEARKRYTEKFGPIAQTDLLGEKRYTWLCEPWPWEYGGRREG